MEHKGLPIVELASQAEWEAWLREHHPSSPGVWVKAAKKGVEGLTHEQAVESALCYGWIDGQGARFDDRFYLQRFTPRRRRSRWSRINRDKAERLIAEGRMQPAGLAQVEAARADGRWDAAYAGSRSAEVPEDLQCALDADPAAAAFFATLDRQNRYAILYRIGDAKRPETRARRIAKFVTMLSAGETLYP